ncbi:hypothetical protein Pfo_023706 [Paulownia fortunei]|nr:hypothetical protein Pfo_023706 [Paulownia fortunei]
MDCAQMSQEKPTAVPTPFRGLRVLLVDNDTASLLDIASKLEDYSYRVTTTELATVALSILQERTDRFDLVMADINMPEIDCFKFIKSVQLIKDFPIILMSSEFKKDMVEEAMIKGACFFLKKPISSKNLKNVWQHVYRKSKYENIRGGKADIKSDADQEADCHGAKVEEEDKVLEIVNERTLSEPESEQVGDSDQIENDLDDLVDGNMLTKLTGICTKRSMSTVNDGLREFKRKRTEDESNERTRAVSSNSEQGNSQSLKPLAGNGREMEDKENGILEKKSRLCWTPDVHLKFKEVTDTKGERESHPESVLEMMKEPDLTQSQVSSHLQKYRVQSPTTELNRTTSLPTDQSKIFETSSNSHSFCEGVSHSNPLNSSWS